MTYDYACTACGHEWEAEHGIKDPPLTECPKCGEPEAHRLISKRPGTGFSLLGSCWAKDCYQ